MEITEVSAAVITCNDKILVTTRPEGKHLAGMWEFPGGKRRPGESGGECLIREIKEELGVCVKVESMIYELLHEYREKTVLLKFYLCSLRNANIPVTPLENQKFTWAGRQEFDNLNFVEADLEFIEFLKGDPEITGLSLSCSRAFPASPPD
jgi:8-oxo-dGTP diphosphatase